MPAILDCQAVADGYLGWVREEVRRLGFKPTLATFVHKPGADGASLQYRDMILKDAERVGAGARQFEAADAAELRAQIERADADPAVQGIVVLYPLRSALHDEDVMDLVSPHKDAEGLHSVNLGYLIKYKRFLDIEREIKCVVPATAKAAVKALQAHPEVAVEGAFAVVVNNSMRVGKPLGLMLENLGATVVKCYHLTKPDVLEDCVRRADILVTAVPDPSFSLDPAWVKPGAAVLDVSHQGNIDVGGLKGKAALVTVPENRLGKITRAMILVNLIYCARYKGTYY